MSLLAGISPWWWLAAAIAFGALEMLTATSYLLWPALAALLIALILWVVPGLSGALQLALFALLTIGLIFAGRTVLRRIKRPERTETLNTRAGQLVGREAQVEHFDRHEGRVTVDGIPWPARLEGDKAPAPGDRVRVVGTDGIVVRVTPI